MSHIGIDYGLGQTNIDRATGIRYGVISQHSVGETWYESAEADYGEPHCPKCGNEAIEASSVDEDTDEWETARFSCGDYACETCCYLFDGDIALSDEPLGYSFIDAEYDLSDCLDSDIMVIRSPYYTRAQFCSPCVPGAGNLDAPTFVSHEGPRTYALGHDWFEGHVAPYPVYRVADDSEVFSDRS